jgi:hypothetical protein
MERCLPEKGARVYYYLFGENVSTRRMSGFPAASSLRPLEKPAVLNKT